MLILKIEGDLLTTQQEVAQVINQIQARQPEQGSAILITGSTKATKELSTMAAASVQQGADFSASILDLELHYLELARTTLPVQHQSSVLSFIRKRFNEADDLCKGIQLLGECPEKTLDEIRAIPSTVLSFIFSAACTSSSLDTIWIKEPVDAEENNQGLFVMADHCLTPSRINTLMARRPKELEIWCKRSAYYTADPDHVKNAMPIASLTYEEAMELSWQENTSTIHPETLGIASKQNIPVRVKEMKSIESEGTLISNNFTPSEKLITGISFLDDASLIRIEGSVMIGVPGFARRVFGTLYEEDINVILISQDASEHAICVAVSRHDGPRAEQSLNAGFREEIGADKLLPVRAMHDLCIIGLVGENMRNHPGISGRMFGALGRNGINILAIAQGSNERNISAVIDASNRLKAINVLHEAFFENVKKEINLYIIGTGNVGRKLIEQINTQSKLIEEKLGIRLNVSGISNSRKMLMDVTINLEHWAEQLDKAEDADLEKFAERVIAHNKRNSVLVDITASSTVTGLYKRLLKKSISVVACNKIAASDRFETYSELKRLALSYNCKFLFETNVGAALPVIGTLNDLIKSGDRINRIEAVLSGTLNYVFNHYDGSKPFSDVVRDAQKEGYTEPDPRLDLSGMDVMRKIMILAREAGEEMEMEEITCEGFLPESCLAGDVENFYEEMKKNEAHFRNLLDKARADNAKLKFVAGFSKGKAAVGLKHIHQESDMYHLYGKDNIVLFHTDRYSQQPLVVKGAGAGAEVTASGVFADIIRTINN